MRTKKNITLNIDRLSVRDYMILIGLRMVLSRSFMTL